MADGPDLGVRTGDRGACVAPDGIGPVRCPSETQDHPGPHGRRPALQHVARRSSQRLGQGAAEAQGEKEDLRLLQRQLLPDHVGQFPHPNADRFHSRDRSGPHPVLGRLAVRKRRSRLRLVQQRQHQRERSREDRPAQCHRPVQARSRPIRCRRTRASIKPRNKRSHNARTQSWEGNDHEQAGNRSSRRARRSKGGKVSLAPRRHDGTAHAV